MCSPVVDHSGICVDPAVSPTPQLTTNTMMQHELFTENSIKFVHPMKDIENKASLSFILSSSYPESDADYSSFKWSDYRTDTNVVKRMRTDVSSSASGPVRKSSKICTVDGCTSRAKHAKLCWKHGGTVKCKVSICINRAKAKGFCWSHGGGTVCSFENCHTMAVSNGFCWAHGGGKRCQVPKCSKVAYKRTQNYCQMHYEELGDC